MGIIYSMNAIRRFWILLLALVFLLEPLGVANAQSSEEEKYFPETGHTVKGDFLRFYRKAADPGLLYGSPITEQFTSRDGRVVQYFQRARFELHPGLAGSASVQLTPLGQAAYEPGGPKLDINNPSACKSFDTGFQVCFAFLDFYEANGGTSQFGKPISPFEFHDNLIVQYFEKARFEWRADRPEGQRVVLTDLGRTYFDRLGEDQAQLRPIRPLDATINPVLSIHARAFVKYAITRSSGQQSVYILVQNQTNQPVSGANGKATIQLSNGQVTEYYFTTNAAGLGAVPFNFEDLKGGELIPVEILVTYQGLATQTSTSFRVWY
ncbi:MAG: carboxypeptidase-like regulatory domain-containing protein [Bacteroidota bacterium]